MKKPRIGTRTKGFTLVELLVVIAIIAALAGLVFALTKGALAKSRLAGSVNRVRDIGVRIQAYTQDNAGQLPVWQDQSQGLYWWGMLIDDVRDKSKLQIFKSPGDKYFDVDRIDATVSYGWNARVCGRYETAEGDEGPKRMVNFRDPSRILVIADGAKTNGFGELGENKLPDPDRYDGKVAALMLDGSGKTLLIESEFKQNAFWFQTEEERENTGNQ
jgi:prepilin-type N-terminal cleavage/methylation domain-containing protein